MSNEARVKSYVGDAHQIPQSVSTPCFWNLAIPLDLLPDQDFDLQLRRLAGTFVFTAKPDFAHSSATRVDGGVSTGFMIEVGVSAPRSIRDEAWVSGSSDMLSSRNGERGGLGRWWDLAVAEVIVVAVILIPTR